jgi:hypothetical protein
MKRLDLVWGGRRIFPVIVACALTVASVTTEAHALEPVFTLGCVSVETGQRAHLRDLLSRAIREELNTPAFAKVRSREQYVLSARLVHLNTARKQDSARATCDVSIVLRKQPSDSLLAVVSGRATAEDEGGHARDAELAAVRGAVHGAMRRVPGALSKLPR